MKILLINDSIQNVGGAESYVLVLKQQLEAEGHEVRLFGVNQGVDLISSLFSRWFSLRYYFQAWRIGRSYRPDVVHAHNLSRALSPSVLFGFGQTPIVQTVHDYHLICPKVWMINDNGQVIVQHDSMIECLSHHFPKRNSLYELPRYLKAHLHKKLINMKVNTYICPSVDLQKFYRGKYWCGRSIYIPNPTPHDIGASPQIKELKFLYVGRLSREKGIDMLIEAFTQLTIEYNDIFLTIAGDGPERRHLTKLINSRGAQKYISIAGGASRKELNDYYASNAVVIVPSVWVENCPMVALEAMVAGRPILASASGGLKNLVVDTKTGVLFERGNIADLKTKLADVIKGKYDLAQMSQQQIQRSEEFSGTSHTQKVLAVYREAQGVA